MRIISEALQRSADYLKKEREEGAARRKAMWETHEAKGAKVMRKKILLRRPNV